MGMLEKAETWLMKMRQKHLATKPAGAGASHVWYNSSPIWGGITRASTTVDSDMGDGVIVRSQVVDWLIDVHHLDTSRRPQPGDIIEIRHNGYPSNLLKDRYEVMDVGGQCWQYHGRTRSTYRIHTRLINEMDRNATAIQCPVPEVDIEHPL